MPEVSCKATRMILEALDGTGFVGDSLVEGLPTSLAELRDPRARIDWHVFVEVLNRIEAACGDTLPPEEIGARVLVVPSFEFLRRAGQLVFSPKQLYEIAQRLVAPSLFPNVIVRLEWLANDHLVVTGELMPGYRESPMFFRLSHGNVAALPRLLGLPPSVIEEQAFSGRRARLVLRLPQSHTLFARVGRAARTIVSLEAVWRGVRRQQEELEESIGALRSSRQELHRLLERLPDGVLVHREGILRWANAAALELFGAQTLDDLLGRTLLDLAPPEDRESLAAGMRRAATNQVVDEPMEYRLQRFDGSLRRVQTRTTLADFEEEKARLIVLRDVTEQHRLREQSAINDRLASIGALAAGVAHEINNPLTYVRLSLDVVARETATMSSRDHATRATLDEALAQAKEGTDRVLEIVRNLRTLSHVRDDASEPVDLPEVLDSTLALARRALDAKARVVRSYGPTPPALATRGKLGQVFLNLLTNAADAIPDGAPSEHVISVRTRTDDRGRVVVEIADDGSGVPPQIAARVFDPFFTTKPVGSGTGLGLAMCHRIVTELGGEISFESAPGATTFRVALPAAPAIEPTHRETSTPQQAPTRTRRRVLVVDDEPALLNMVSRLLRGVHEVVTAESGRRALAILNDDDRFDVVLADLMMADLTGMDVYEAACSRHPSLERRFVFMTGGAFTARARKFLASVPSRCVEKPFQISELLDAVESIAGAA